MQSATLQSIGLISGIQNTEAVFKEKRGVWDPMLELDGYDLTLPHSRLQSPASHLNYKKKGVGWGRSLLLVGHEHICICLLISITCFLCQ
jgi:hypothetical protein